MITKSKQTTRIQWKIRIFPHKSHEKSLFAHRNTQVREGGRTVGSGRVATIIE